MGFDRQVQTIPNVPDWEEDPNSPREESGVGSVTQTVANERDIQAVFFRIQNNGISDMQVDCQVNDVATASYFIFRLDGSSTSDATRWQDVLRLQETQEIYGRFLLAGNWGGNGSWVQTVGGVATETTPDQLVRGTNTTAVEPLEQFTLLFTNNDADVSLEVYGRDIV